VLMPSNLPAKCLPTRARPSRMGEVPSAVCENTLAYHRALLAGVKSRICSYFAAATGVPGFAVTKPMRYLSSNGAKAELKALLVIVSLVR
jgi:hypothetical protein